MAGLRVSRLVSPRAATVLALVLVAAAVAACGSGGGASTTRSGLVPIGAGLQGPEGLAATVYATGIPTATAALVTEWQTGRVLRVTLAKSGSTYTGGATPLLTGIRNPLALAATRDGALLVGDWGTGRIYRIARA